ncbi:hypothetical protein ADK77_08050 [Streptomyces antibioticus]|nr:hypothetical protein ADK77_08050 [Streptomyces antibioticus]
MDLDKPKSDTDAPDGAASFEALCERHGQPVPTTRTIRTASGGAHLYFTSPGGTRLSNTAGTLAPLVDTRAYGGYVVAAGSVVDGFRYRVDGAALLRPVPQWLLAILAPPHPVNRPAASAPLPVVAAGRRGRYAEAALRHETATVAAAQEGGRNAALLRAARALGRFVASGELPRALVEEALQGAGEVAGLPPAECRATIRSALDWSIAHNPSRAAA